MPDLDDLMAISKSTDQLALLKAKEAAKKKMATDPKPGDLEVFKRTQAALEKPESAASAAVIYRTQLEAVEYLQAQGYKISKSKLSLDLRKKRLPTAPEGGFEASALLGYARTHCTPLARAEDHNESSANLERIKADAANKQAMAERNRLKLERERGNLINRDDHETELAARAAFFRREIETFGRRLAPRLIALVGGDEASEEPLLQFWAEETEIWMDAWSRDRAFVVPLGLAGEDEPEPDRAEPVENPAAEDILSDDDDEL